MNHNRQSLALVAAALLLAPSPGARAHHDVSADIDIGAPVEVVGQVARIDWQRPHSTLTLRLGREGRSDQVWTVQLDSMGQLAESAFGERVVHVDDWVKVLLYPSLSAPCADACSGYGLSLTTESGSTYTLGKRIESRLVETLQRRN